MKPEICEIYTLDSVHTVCNNTAADNLRNLLSYDEYLWIPTRFGKRKKKNKKYLIDSRKNGEHYFLTGLVDRCLDYLDHHGIEYIYESDIDQVEFDDPHVEGITFRSYQEELINTALEIGRGVIKAPTATGKSIIILGIVSAFSQENILFLAHTQDLVAQMKEHFIKNGFPDVGEWTGNLHQMERITVATVQAYRNVAREYTDHWDVVFVDEGHHVTKWNNGNYFTALGMSGAPCKFATTATMPEKDEAQWALEGLIGPVIGEYTMKEAQEDGFLSKPNIIMYPVDLPQEIWNMKNYQKVYTEGIVMNTVRNIRIAGEAEKRIENGSTVLILVTRIKHADRLQALIDYPVEIIKGAVSKEERLRIKEELKSNELSCVIATVAWVEGVDIPNLNCVINAAAGKSEIQTLQKLGRGLRKTKEKDTVDILDFYDIGNKFLQKHSKLRKAIYEEQGWKVKSK